MPCVFIPRGRGGCWGGIGSLLCWPSTSKGRQRFMESGYGASDGEVQGDCARQGRLALQGGHGHLAD